VRTAYFDTNVYNNWVLRGGLVDTPRVAEALTAAGIRVLLSPINVVEILQTADPGRREDLVMACQAVCDAEMLVEPEALVVDQLVSLVPDDRIAHFTLKTATDGSVLAAVWADVHVDRRRTFGVDGADLKRFDVARAVFAYYYHSHFSRGGTIEDADLLSGKSSSSAGDILYSIREARTRALGKAVAAGRLPRVGEHLFLLAVAVLCVGWTPFPLRIDAYWRALGLDLTADRVDYVGAKLWPLLHLTALHGLAAIMAWQSTQAYNPGNFFDCYHVAYLPHVDLFVTDDAQLSRAREWWPESTLLAKIVGTETLQGEMAG